MKKQRTFTRTFCASLSTVMLLLILAVFPAVAEDTSDDIEITHVPMEDVEILTPTSTTTEQEPELLDATSGNVVMDLEKTYRLEHDDFEITAIYAYDSIAQVKVGNLLYANAIGTAQITLLYYNENNILSTFTCQVEVIDVLGTIDVTRSNVFVEKGQKYILDFGDLDVYSVNIMNYDTLILRSLANGKAIEAVETDTVNIQYNYYAEDGTSVSTVCTVDVFEAVSDQYNGEYVIQEDDTATYMVNDTPLVLDSPLKTISDADRSNDHNRWYIRPTGDGYYFIQSVGSILWVTVADNSSAEGAPIQLSSNLSVTGARWKILKNNLGRILLTPECAESQNLVMWIAADTADGNTLELMDYYGDKHSDIHNNGWDIFDDTKYYIDNYYDISLQASPIVDFIPAANNFVINVFAEHNFPIEVYQEATYYENLTINNCTNDINEPCSSTCAPPDSEFLHKNHHKDRIKYNNEVQIRVHHSDSHTIVMWANRDRNAYCFGNDRDHQTGASYAIGGISYNKTIFYSLTQNLLYSQALMSILYCHEFSHNMGLDEQYQISGHDLYQGMNCVMEYMNDYEAYAFYLYLTENNGEYYDKAHCASCQTKLLTTTPFFELSD